LTHNEQLHQVNLGWHSQGKEMLWQPDLHSSKNFSDRRQRALQMRFEEKFG
jgi:hypothetical protein